VKRKHPVFVRSPLLSRISVVDVDVLTGVYNVRFESSISSLLLQSCDTPLVTVLRNKIRPRPFALEYMLNE
jgi:hypothetical protein